MSWFNYTLPQTSNFRVESMQTLLEVHHPREYVTEVGRRELRFLQTFYLNNVSRAIETVWDSFENTY